MAASVENLMSKMRFKEKNIIAEIHSEPNKIRNINRNLRRILINEASQKLLKSLCGKRGLVQHDNVVAEWLYSTSGTDFSTASTTTAWYIENTIAQSTGKVPQLSRLFDGMMKLLPFIFMVNQLVSTNNECSTEPFPFVEVMAPSVRNYSIDEGLEAIKDIGDWIKNETIDYLKIVDPYFDEKFLCLLKEVPQGTRVQIILSKSNKNEAFKDETERLFKKMWLSICDQKPPETHVYIFSTPSRRTPIHSRFIFTKEKGLVLGTSFNGFGSKESYINYVDLEAKDSYEQVINNLVVNTPLEFKGEKLRLDIFDL